MIKCNLLYLLLGLIISASIIFSSCKNLTSVPFPENDLGYSPPVTSALEFTAPKLLKWDTVKQSGIQPLVKYLDIQALPALRYDTNSFSAFTKPPAVTQFDWNSLPGTNIKIDALKSTPLHFKTSVLTPSTVKVLAPAAQKGKAHSIHDFGTVQGFQPKFITALLNDKNGLLWIATAEGLYRYDGTHIQTFLADLNWSIVDMIEDKDGLLWYVQTGEGFGVIDPAKGIVKTSNKIGNIANNVTQMSIDKDGRIWVYNIADRGVCIVDPKTESYKKLAIENGLSDTTSFAIMHDNNNLTWITNRSGGINIIEQATGKIKYLGKKEGLSSDSVSAVIQDKFGKVWVAGANGLDAIDLKTGTILHFGANQGMGRNYVFDLKTDNKGNVWIGTTKGVQVLDPKKGSIKSLRQNDGIAGSVVTAFAQDNLKRMWIATTTGLNVIGQNAEAVHQLNSNVIVTILEDNAGNVWIGTNAGVYIVDVKKNNYRILNTSKGLGNDFVQNFTRFNKEMWVGTNGGLDIVNTEAKTIEHIGKKEGLFNDTIYAVFRDNAGNIWLTGPSNGIDMIAAANKRIYHTEMSGGLSDNNIQDIKEDNNGFIWLATNKGGINVYDPKSQTVRYLNNLPGLRDVCSKMMLKDRYGRIWIGTNKGLYVTDGSLGTITAITTRNGLPSNRVLSLLEYKGDIIVGTNSKAAIITPPPAGSAAGKSASPDRGWKISWLKNSHLLVRERTNSWSTDAVTSTGQYLWGDQGLTMLDELKPETDSVPTFITGMNVMTEAQRFVNRMVVGEKDTLWAADTFYTKGDIIKNLTAYKRKFKWDSVTGPYNLPVNLHLPYDRNYLQLQFTQAHLGRPDSILYTYVLEGIDKNWSTPSINPYTENYLNLPPGSYTFKVASKGISGKWSQPASFSFTISPPWYKTWWAFIALGVIAVTGLRAYVVYRSRRLQRENKLLEERIAVRTGQLQKSLEDLKATQMQLIQSEKMASLGELTAGIAHEIQNPLNFVNNFSEVNKELIEEMELEIDKGNLNEVKALATDIKDNELKISQHGKRADAIVKGMLLHSRANTGKKEPTDINSLADEYLRLSYHGLRAKDKSFNADFKTDFDKNLNKINVVPQDIGRVFLNLYNNAFYSVNQKKQKLNGSFRPTVSVITRKAGNKVEIVVKDNGSGVSEKVLDKIFQPFYTTKPTGEGTGLGLSLSYDIIKANGGELKVATSEGEFAEFTIILPLS